MKEEMAAVENELKTMTEEMAAKEEVEARKEVATKKEEEEEEAKRPKEGTKDMAVRWMKDGGLGCSKGHPV
jgi:hypothetical protein